MNLSFNCFVFYFCLKKDSKLSQKITKRPKISKGSNSPASAETTANTTKFEIKTSNEKKCLKNNAKKKIF